MPALTRIDPAPSATGKDQRDPARFCTRCGRAPSAPRRVCEHCGMGVVLACRHDSAPPAGGAFLICTYDLTVSAVSAAAEDVFGRQDDLVGSELLALVACPLGQDQLGRYAQLAALRPAEPVVLPLRPLADGAGRIGSLTARIGTCGPPRAALVTVAPSGFGRR